MATCVHDSILTKKRRERITVARRPDMRINDLSAELLVNHLAINTTATNRQKAVKHYLRVRDFMTQLRTCVHSFVLYIL